MYRNQVNRYDQNVKLQVAAHPGPTRSRSRQALKPSPAKLRETKAEKGRSRARSWLLIFLLVLLLLVLSPFVIVQLINLTNESRIYNSVAQTPARPVAMVFGAGLNRDGTPS